MEQPAKHDTGGTLADLVAAAGITVTPEGQARARQKLDEARQRRTPAALAAMRAKIRQAASTA